MGGGCRGGSKNGICKRYATKKKGSLGCLSAESDANLFHAILLAELLDTTGGVNGLLLAGVEGVAL
jgi:hypothetical protein